VFLLIGLGIGCSNGLAQEAEPAVHRHIDTVLHADLKGLVSIVGSKDGKFLYGAALESQKIVTLRRDPESGLVEVVDSIGDLEGAVCLAISDDQKWVVMTSCTSSLLTLYARDEAAGTLTEVSRQKQGIDNVDGLHFPIAITISPDSRFVYVTDAGGAGSLTAFEIVDGKLEFLQKHDGVEGCMKGARLLTVDPKGEYLFVACALANCLTVFDRDINKGHLRVLHYLRDGTEDCNLLAGAHGLACDSDGEHLYLASGRFSGDNGITVFEILQREQLEVVQELKDGESLPQFKAGNFIAVSNDGKFVYATGAKSGNILCLKRDAESGELRYLRDFELSDGGEFGMTGGIYLSSDDRFIYVAGEGEKNLFIFERQK